MSVQNTLRLLLNSFAAPEASHHKGTTQPPGVIWHHMPHYTSHDVPCACTPQPPEPFPK